LFAILVFHSCADFCISILQIEKFQFNFIFHFVRRMGVFESVLHPYLFACRIDTKLQTERNTSLPFIYQVFILKLIKNAPLEPWPQMSTVCRFEYQSNAIFIIRCLHFLLLLSLLFAHASIINNRSVNGILLKQNFHCI
jgi:hypothetical protein